HQASIPQLRIEVDRERALAHGITPGELNRKLPTLLGRAHMASLRADQRSLDLVIRLPEDWPTNASALPPLPIATPSGRHLSLGSIAEIREAVGPSAVFRENTQRRYVISIQPTQRDAGALVRQLQERVSEEIRLPEGVFIQYEGEFLAEQAAAKRI